MGRTARSVALGVVALGPVALGLIAVACTTPPDPPADAGLDVTFAGEASVELGEGERSFRPIEDGDTLLLGRGCQGSQHVWITLRARNMVLRGMRIRLRLLDAGGTEVGVPFYVPLSFTPSCDGDFGSIDGLTLQIEDPWPILGQPVTVVVELQDRTGRTATARRDVTIAWGTQVCMAVVRDGGVDGDVELDAGVGAPDDAGTDETDAPGPVCVDPVDAGPTDAPFLDAFRP